MDSFPGLEIREFANHDALRTWLEENHATSTGIWVRVYKTNSAHQSVRFEELLNLGLCFGWSESLRRAGDSDSYLQRFTPRRTTGTTSQRNRDLAVRLVVSGEMTAAGLEALGLKP
jgi:uncharacterized protein YdeI (YjbR/CyaY-like superfamily)